MPFVAPEAFLIDGVSSGLGRAFAEGVLAAGHRVIGTVRRVDDAEASAALAPGRAHPLVLDVTDYGVIPAAKADAERAGDAPPDGAANVRCRTAGHMIRRQAWVASRRHPSASAP